jgi:hypothetical protein
LSKSEVRFFSVDDLVGAFEGTTRKDWLSRLLPLLRRQGVLVKVGRKFVGKVAAIETELMGQAAGGAR